METPTGQLTSGRIPKPEAEVHFIKTDYTMKGANKEKSVHPDRFSYRIDQGELAGIKYQKLPPIQIKTGLEKESGLLERKMLQHETMGVDGFSHPFANTSKSQ